MPGCWRERGRALRNRSRYSTGQVSIETTFFIIFFVIMLFGAFELGTALSIKHSMDVGCYRAARYLSFAPSDTATAEQMIRDEVDNNLLGGGYGSQITVAIDFPAGTDFQDPIIVTASLDWQGVVPFLNLVPVTLRARHTEVVERYP